jgi:transposase
MATVKYKRDLKALEQRRRKGMRMLGRGVTQAEVARALDVSRQTVSNWARAAAGKAQAWRRKPLGRPAGMSMAEKSRLSKRLVAGAVAWGFPTEL